MSEATGAFGLSKHLKKMKIRWTGSCRLPMRIPDEFIIGGVTFEKSFFRKRTNKQKAEAEQQLCQTYLYSWQCQKCIQNYCLAVIYVL